MTKIIALANHKGGVAKTTTAVNLGTILSGRGKKTLLVDLDAQANLTSSFLKDLQEETLYSAMIDETGLPIIEIRENLSLVPSSLQMAGIELDISGRMQREFILKDLLEEVKDNYDYILLDCPPSLGLITINAFVASTDIYVPLTAEALPSLGLKMLLDIFFMVKKRLNPSLSFSGIIITRYEKSKLSQMVEDTLRENFNEVVFNTKIRKNISLAEAPLYAKDIVTYAPDSNGAKDYEALADEVLARERE